MSTEPEHQAWCGKRDRDLTGDSTEVEPSDSRLPLSHCATWSKSLTLVRLSFCICKMGPRAELITRSLRCASAMKDKSWPLACAEHSVLAVRIISTFLVLRLLITAIYYNNKELSLFPARVCHGLCADSTPETYKKHSPHQRRPHQNSDVTVF